MWEQAVKVGGNIFSDTLLTVIFTLLIVTFNHKITVDAVWVLATVYICVYKLYTYVFLCMYVYIYMYVCVYIYICIHTYIRKHKERERERERERGTCICMYEYADFSHLCDLRQTQLSHTHSHTYACAHTKWHTQTCTHIRTRAHTHTFLHSKHINLVTHTLTHFGTANTKILSRVLKLSTSSKWVWLKNQNLTRL